MIEDRHSREKVIELEIYTDGSLKTMGRMGFGGWAFIVIRDGKIVAKASDSEANSTNQRMELTAIARALSFIKDERRPCEKVIVYSDSAYAINCYTQHWYEKWRKNGWVNAKEESVANQDLWRQIIPFFDNLWYTFRKVPAHSGVFWNEECDTMAQQQAEQLKINWRGKENE